MNGEGTVRLGTYRDFSLTPRKGESRLARGKLCNRLHTARYNGRARPGESAVQNDRGGATLTSISSKNAIKQGFFSKDVISAHRLDPAARDEYLQLLKGLCADWKPVGASEFIQVELMAAHLVQYRSFRRFERALVLAKITPDPDALYEEWERRIRMESGPIMLEEDAEAEIEYAKLDKLIYERSKGEINVCEETHQQIDRWKREFPPMEHFDKLQRYEDHILRNYYRAVSELERMQRMRLGEKVPPRMVVELQNG